MRLSGVQMERLNPEVGCLPTTSNERGSAGRRTAMLSALKKPLKLLSASEEHARMLSGSRRRPQRSLYPSRCNSPASRPLRARFGMSTRLPSRRLGISSLRAALVYRRATNAQNLGGSPPPSAADFRPVRAVGRLENRPRQGDPPLRRPSASRSTSTRPSQASTPSGFTNSEDMGIPPLSCSIARQTSRKSRGNAEKMP